ncbi:hypothetical protein EUTSA_v10021643mg [Eutrema salsugineum]|uniref:Uncharacterized protein n=1 Tax=Eutrema salsugineum TaxID=72664 RepID=V4NQX8_EUTSA|nr:hypothetical protein EUTSA_v10021643mg [Eutrema salsugineum]
MHFASHSEKYLPYLELLLERGASMNVLNNKDDTPLHIACLASNLKAAQLLLERGADIESQNQNHGTPLHCACHVGCANIEELLLNRGANIESQNNSEQRPLHLACTHSSKLPCAEMLLDKGAEIEYEDDEGMSPLTTALDNKNLECVTVGLHNLKLMEILLWWLIERNLFLFC